MVSYGDAMIRNQQQGSQVKGQNKLYLHIIHFRQPDAELTTRAPRGLWCITHANNELFFTFLAKRVG
jgi:hypothetical protein